MWHYIISYHEDILDSPSKLLKYRVKILEEEPRYYKTSLCLRLEVWTTRFLNPTAHTSFPCSWILVWEMRVCPRKAKLLPLGLDFLQDCWISSLDLDCKLIELRKLHLREGHLWISGLVSISFWQRTERLQYLRNEENFRILKNWPGKWNCSSPGGWRSWI